MSDIGATAAGTPPSASADRHDANEIARMEKDLATYRREREKVVQSRTTDPPAFQLALPVNDRGYMPYVPADQLKLIDRIMDSYLGRPPHEMKMMWEELEANGLTPNQLARTAKHFINLKGEIVGRAEATGGAPSAAQGGTAWTASLV
ncbi:hypothetical protein [Azospirillum halopraeferens]|uniref:hypothetical protein n=1 Tax=Azospirillum halopraeferens TaxID=34010 RepID=UPI0012EB9D84|nr:hypothetical protein [Azospirillum halopraeferens]